MTNNKVQVCGAACSHHGSYSFYKGLRYTDRQGKSRILALGEFFLLKIWEEEDIVSIGEPQLIWEDRSSNNTLVSLRLYFVPENTPEGRNEEHGEHEVISLSDKVVIKAEDLVTLIRTPEEVQWTTGFKGVYGPHPNVLSDTRYTSTKTVTTNGTSATPNNKLANNNNNIHCEETTTPQVKQERLKEGEVKVEVKCEVKSEVKCEVKSEVKFEVNAQTDSIQNGDTVIKKEEEDVKVSITPSVRSSSRTSLNSCLPETMYYPPPVMGGIDIKEIKREKKVIGDVIEEHTHHVIVLTYDKYCRVRSMLKRIGVVNEDSLRTLLVQSLGGFLSPSRNTLLLFCKDVFEYPDLETHDLLCNHLAPKLQGRPRKKNKKRPGTINASDSDSSEETVTGDDISQVSHKLKGKGLSIPNKPGLTPKQSGSLRALDRKIKPQGGMMYPGMGSNVFGNAAGTLAALMAGNAGNRRGYKTPHALSASDNKHKRSYLNSPQQSRSHQSGNHSPHPSDFPTPAINRLIEADFMTKLHKYMKDRKTPITRLPHVGNRQLNLFELFSKVQQLGGYDAVSAHHQWCALYEQMGGMSGQQLSLNAAGNTLKKHYERLLYPYEKFLLQEQGGNVSTPSTYTNTTSSEASLTQSTAANLAVPKVSSGSSLPSDLAKRPEITITPIPRVAQNPLNDNFSSMLKAAVSAAQTAGIPTATALKALGFDQHIPGLESQMSDLGPLFGLNDQLSKKLMSELIGNNSPYQPNSSQSSITLEPAPKRFKHEDNRLNGSTNKLQSSRGMQSPHSHLMGDLSKRATGNSVPDLLSADIIRQMYEGQDKNSPSLLPAHQSNKTINALAALLPQTSIFPAPAAHQQNSLARSPLKNVPSVPHQMHMSDSPRHEPPKVFQSQNLYAQSSRIYDRPQVPSPTNKTAKIPPSKPRKSSSPEVQILDLSRPPSSQSRPKRMDSELLDLSARRDITVSAIPKSNKAQRDFRSNNAILEGLTITPSNKNFKASTSEAAMLNMPALLAAAAASQGLPPGLSHQGLPPSLASLGLASPSGGINPSLIPYLMGGVSQSSPSPKQNHPLLSGGMSPYMDPSAMAAYYSSLSGQNSSQSHSAAVAALQMAQLQSLGLAQPPPPPTSLAESINNLGMYKNFLGAAAANSIPPVSNASSFPAQHFLAALMGNNSGAHNKQKK